MLEVATSSLAKTAPKVAAASIMAKTVISSILEAGGFHYGQNYVCFERRRWLLPLCPKSPLFQY